MTSCNTNVLAYALNTDAPEHARALQFLAAHQEDRAFGLSEIVLVELYNLLRNAAVFEKPYSPARAVEKIEELRANPHWKIFKGAVDVSNSIWRVAATPGFPRRAIFDARLAYALAAEGVTRFATRNVGDFRRFGTFEVFDPILEAA